MFLGVIMEEMNLARLGWCIMIGWALWVVILPLVMEILKISKIGVNKRCIYFSFISCMLKFNI